MIEFGSSTINEKKGSELKNCIYCPSYKKTCNGDVVNCLCLKCPRNLGQCIKVRYCRETESVLDDLFNEGLVSDEELKEQMKSYFKTME